MEQYNAPYPKNMKRPSKMEQLKLTIEASLVDCEDMLEYERESVSVEECEKHRDFCLELLEFFKE